MNNRRLLIKLFSAFLLTSILVGCNKKLNYNEEIYQIYELAKDDGYQGTFEEWIDTIKGEKGDKGEPGKDGYTPVITIGENGNWVFDGVDTGIIAEGEDGKNGHTPEIIIGENGNWFLDGVDTNINANGSKGESGISGKDGSTLHYGNRNPNVFVGKNGDSYVNKETWDFFVNENGKWILKGNILESKISCNHTYDYNIEFIEEYVLKETYTCLKCEYSYSILYDLTDENISYPENIPNTSDYSSEYTTSIDYSSNYYPYESSSQTSISEETTSESINTSSIIEYIISDKTLPEGLTYVTNNPEYPDAGWYPDGGLKLNFINQGLLTEKFLTSNGVTLILDVNALNENTNEGTYSKAFTVYGLNTRGEVVATAELDTVNVGYNFISLNGTGIVQVKVIMTGYPHNGNRLCNVNVGGLTIYRHEYNETPVTSETITTSEYWSSYEETSEITSPPPMSEYWSSEPEQTSEPSSNYINNNIEYTINGSIPDGLRYIKNNVESNPQFYTNGGLKGNTLNAGLETVYAFTPQSNVTVILNVNGLNKNSHTGSDADAFTFYGLNARNEVVAVTTLDNILSGENVVELTGSEIVRVRIIMRDYVQNGTLCYNVNIKGVSIYLSGSNDDYVTSEYWSSDVAHSLSDYWSSYEVPSTSNDYEASETPVTSETTSNPSTSEENSEEKTISYEIGKSFPTGLTYIPNDENYPDPNMSTSTDGVKFNFEGMGLQTAKFDSSSSVFVSLHILELNGNEKTGTSNNLFTFYGLNANGQVVDTEVLTSVEEGENSVTLEGQGIVQVKVIMTGFPHNGNKYCNPKITGLTLVLGESSSSNPTTSETPSTSEE